MNARNACKRVGRSSMVTDLFKKLINIHKSVVTAVYSSSGVSAGTLFVLVRNVTVIFIPF